MPALVSTGLLRSTAIALADAWRLQGEIRLTMSEAVVILDRNGLGNLSAALHCLLWKARELLLPAAKTGTA